MSSFVMDFSSETGVPQATDGDHTAECVLQKQGVSSRNANNLTLSLQWLIKQSDDERNVGRKVFDTLTFTEGAFWKVVMLMRATCMDLARWQGQAFTPAIITEIGEALIGEVIVIRTMQKAQEGINPQTGDPYSKKANITAYKPFGAATSAGQMVSKPASNDLDDVFGDQSPG